MAIIILYLGLLTILGMEIPIVGDYLVLGLKYIIQFLNWSVVKIDQLPYSLTQNIRFSVADTWLIYLAIVFIVLLISYRKFKFFMFSALSIIIFLMSFIWRDYKDLKQHQLIIYNIPQNTSINFIDGTDNILVSDIKLLQNRSKLLFHVQNNWINKGVNNEKVVPFSHLDKKHQLSNLYRISNINLFTKKNYFQYYYYKLAIIDNKTKIAPAKEKLAVDALLISKNTSYSLEEILQAYHPKEIIIDASNSTYVANKLSEEAKTLNIKCYNIIKEDAFVRTI